MPARGFQRGTERQGRVKIPKHRDTATPPHPEPLAPIARNQSEFNLACRIAQLVEQLTVNQRVLGSSPNAAATYFWASVGISLPSLPSFENCPGRQPAVVNLVDIPEGVCVVKHGIPNSRMVEMVLALAIALASGQGAGKSPSLATELALARRDGMCTTLAELRTKFASSHDQDAGPIYRRILELTTTGVKSTRAFSKIFSPGSKPTLKQFLGATEAVEGSAPGSAKYANDLRAILSAGRNPTPEQTLAADKAVADFAPVYTLAAEAADRPHCSLVGYYGAPDMTFPICAGLKGIAKCLVYRARRRAAQGDWRGALQDVRTIVRTGRHAAEYPTFIGMFVGIAIDLIGEQTLDEIIDRNSHDTTFLSSAKRLSDDMDALPNLKHAVLGEYLQSLMLLSMPPTDASTRALSVKVLRRWRALYEALPEDPARWQDVYPAARRACSGGHVRSFDKRAYARLPFGS